MATTSEIPSPDVSSPERIVGSLELIAERVRALKAEGHAIVLTSGSFDLIHLGHVKYLAKAKELGDKLVVGVDSDAKIRKRKGSGRPMVPQAERLELLAQQRPVDLVYLKDDDGRWALIRAVEPDVLVVSEDHGHTPDDERELLRHCGRIEVLERQASVTTTERIRQMYMHLGEQLGPGLADELADTLRTKVAEVLPGLIDAFLRRG